MRALGRIAENRAVAGRRAVIVTVLVIVVGSACGSSASDGAGDRAVRAEKNEVAAVGPDVDVVAAAPRAITNPSAIVWTGGEFVVVNSGPTTEAFTYDPGRDRWASLPRFPTSTPLFYVSMVWAADRVVVIGNACDNTAAATDEEVVCKNPRIVVASYRPGDSNWTDAAAIPDASANTDGTWGRALGVVGDEAFYATEGGIKAFDPSTGTWREVAKDRFEDTNMCATPHGLVNWSWNGSGGLKPGTQPSEVITPENYSVPDEDGFSVDMLAKGSDSWGEVAEIVDPVGADSYDMVCGADQVLVYSKSLEHAWLLDLDVSPVRSTRLDPIPAALQDRPLPGPDPVRVQTTFANAQWTGSEFYFWNAPFSTTLPAEPVDNPHAGESVTWPGNAALLSPSNGDWRSAAIGPAFGTRPNGLVAWVGGTAWMIGLQSGQPQIAKFTPGM